MQMQMSCDAARCGVVWCGVVWCGVVWCGVVCTPPLGRCHDFQKVPLFQPVQTSNWRRFEQV